MSKRHPKVNPSDAPNPPMDNDELDLAYEFTRKKKKGQPEPPPLSLIEAETDRLGLPRSDAQFALDSWLANGFRNGRNRVVADWRASLRVWMAKGWFPSQRNTPQTFQKAKDDAKTAQLERMRNASRNRPRST